jgi:LPXTG-site transpeptidase (sortase) family protein
MTLQSPRLVVAGVSVMMAGLLGLDISANGNWSAGATPLAAGPAPAAPAGTPSTTTTLPPSPTQSSPTSSATFRGAKVWLEIPAIHVDQRVTPQGLMGGKINPSARQLIWFTGSGRVQPGKVGTAVIAGHIIAKGVPDVFYHLDRLHKGSVVRLRDADGRTLTMKVVQTLTVDKTALQTNQTVWGGNTTVPRIALVTCDDALGLRPDGHRVANFVAIAEPA